MEQGGEREYLEKGESMCSYLERVEKAWLI